MRIFRMPNSFQVRASFLAALVAASFGASSASAFCRSTTCSGACARDDDGCKTTGIPLAWPGLCVGFSVQHDGTRNLPMADVRSAIEASFVTWSDLDCGGGTSSVAFSELDDVACHRSEYNTAGPNANVILFQDDRWSYKGIDDTLAKTTVTFDHETGAILDADIEVNYALNEFTVGDARVVYDLQSVLTHEIGHFIGLDHSPDPSATMNAAYIEGDTSLRTLEVDDITAVCTVYPPNRPGVCAPTPRGGLAHDCAQDGGADSASGCAFAATNPRRWGPVVFLACGVALSLRRRGFYSRHRRPA
jgi:hypothetical protein